VRVVTDAPLAEPDRLADAEVVAEGTLVAVAIEAGITHLRVGEEPLLRHEQRSLAIGLDAASLEHEARGGVVGARGLVTRQVRDALDRAPDLGVASEVGILRPRIERPVHELHAPRFVVDEGGGGVAQPDAIGWNKVPSNILRHTMRAELHVALGAHALVVAEDLDALVLREHADDLGVDPRNGTEL